MHDEQRIFDLVRQLAGSENDRLARRYGLASTDAPIAGLNIIHQHATVSAELLSFYIGWSQDHAHIPHDPEKRRIESLQRDITIGKSALILSLSAVESSAKSALATNRSVLGATNRRVYLRWIMEQSADAGVISEEVKRSWDAVIELRNALVHNNAVPEQTLETQLPGGPTIALVDGQMIRGSTRLLPDVLLWTTRAFAEWSDAFLQRARAA